MAVAVQIPENIAAFLDTPTPEEWLAEACGRLPEMLLDHANCELKAASTALGFLYRYPERTALAQRMSRLAREERLRLDDIEEAVQCIWVILHGLVSTRVSYANYPWTDSHIEQSIEILLRGLLKEAGRVTQLGRVGREVRRDAAKRMHRAGVDLAVGLRRR